MPDIDALFLQLMDDKKAMYVALALEHDSTKIVERWAKEKKVPEARKWQVMELLKSEGYLS